MYSETDTTDGRTLSLAEFMELPEEDECLLELVRGRVVREPRPQPLHGRIQVRLAGLLNAYAEGVGGAVLADTGFRLEEDPPTVRAPDLAFVSAGRVPPGGYDVPGFWRLAPDLAVEIVSPSNTASAMQSKALEYLRAGARLVWVVHPGSRQVTVYRSRHDIGILDDGDSLDGGEVLPGLTLPVAEIFRL